MRAYAHMTQAEWLGPLRVHGYLIEASGSSSETRPSF